MSPRHGAKLSRGAVAAALICWIVGQRIAPHAMPALIARQWLGGQSADRPAADDVVPLKGLGSMMGDMRTLLRTEVAALLDRTGAVQAVFARPVGVTPRRVNNRVRSRAAVQGWAALLVVVLDDTTVKALPLMLADAQLSYDQVLGLPHGADMATLPRALRRLALLYHPDRSSRPGQIPVVNAAYVEATKAVLRGS